MENPNKDEINLKTFNTAKRYAESIIFPKMDLFQKYQRQADFGSDDLNNSSNLSEEVRSIERYNGLKAMNDILYNLLINISSTVKLKNNKKEIEKLNECIEISNQIKTIFYSNKEYFFRSEYVNQKLVDTIDRIYFEKIRNIIDTVYINTEILMTRNKLLFADSNDEYMSDDEIKEALKKEYIEN